TGSALPWPLHCGPAINRTTRATISRRSNNRAHSFNCRFRDCRDWDSTKSSTLPTLMVRACLLLHKWMIRGSKSPHSAQRYVGFVKVISVQSGPFLEEQL